VVEATTLPEKPTTHDDRTAHAANITCPVSWPRTADHLLARSPIRTLRGDRDRERKIQGSGQAKRAAIPQVPRDPHYRPAELETRRLSALNRAVGS
jgi:hypothetical protein